jgi:hypothetical protein
MGKGNFKASEKALPILEIVFFKVLALSLSFAAFFLAAAAA